MKRSIFIVVAVIIAGLCGCASGKNPKQNPFAGLNDVSGSPSVFFPATVSDPITQQWEFAFSKDGRHLFHATDGPRRIVVQEWNGLRWSKPVALLRKIRSDHGGVSVAPNGRELYFSWSRQGRPRDIYRLRLGQPGAAPEQLTNTPLTGEISLSVDRDGRGFLWTDRKPDGTAGLGFFQTRRRDIGIDVTEPAVKIARGANGPFVDPDGRFLLFASYETSKMQEDLFFAELRDGVALPPVSLGNLVNSNFNDASPQLSPDGRFLLFSSDRPASSGISGDYQIWHMPTAAIPVLKAALTSRAVETYPRPTPREGPIVTSSELKAHDGLQVLAATGNAFSGIVEDWHANKKVRARYSLVEGRAQGVWLEWYDTGAVKFYSEWRDGLGDGTWIYFHPNGEISERVQVKADIWNGLAEGWNLDGTKGFESIFRQGVRTSYRKFDSKETNVVN